jgi:hypothetical protein
MAQPSVPCPSLRVSKDVLGLVRKRSALRLSLLHIAVLISSVSSSAQSAQQQYVYGSVPVSTTASQVVAYSKAAQSGALSAVAGSPFSDALLGGAMAIDGERRAAELKARAPAAWQMFRTRLFQMPPQKIPIWSRPDRFAWRPKNPGSSCM